jgi:putative SOS response-associated peptidase YedK
MPVILDPDGYDLWLDPGMRDAGAASDLLKPYASSSKAKNEKVQKQQERHTTEHASHCMQRAPVCD